MVASCANLQMPTHYAYLFFGVSQDYGDNIDIGGFDIDYGVREIN